MMTTKIVNPMCTDALCVMMQGEHESHLLGVDIVEYCRNGHYLPDMGLMPSGECRACQRESERRFREKRRRNRV